MGSSRIRLAIHQGRRRHLQDGREGVEKPRSRGCEEVPRPRNSDNPRPRRSPLTEENNMSVPVKMPAQGDIMESVIAKGDLAKLTPDERVRYYNEVCRSMGLNPLTQPFSYITLNGKLT